MMRTCISILPAVILALVGVEARAQGFPEGLRFGVEGSYCELTPDEFTTFPGSPGFAATMGRIDKALGIEVGSGYSFGSRFGLIVRSGYLRGSEEDVRTVFIPGEGDVEMTEEWRLTLVPVSVGADYRWEMGVVTAVAEMAAEVYFVDWSLHTEFSGSATRQGIDTTIEDKSVVAGRGGLAVEWSPMAKFVLGIRAGYRIAEKASFNSFTLDATGWSVGAYLSVKPWAKI